MACSSDERQCAHVEENHARDGQRSLQGGPGEERLISHYLRDAPRVGRVAAVNREDAIAGSAHGIGATQATRAEGGDAELLGSRGGQLRLPLSLAFAGAPGWPCANGVAWTSGLGPHALMIPTVRTRSRMRCRQLYQLNS
eukprot:349945-Chlamydomonas_euryale.AAC.5